MFNVIENIHLLQCVEHSSNMNISYASVISLLKIMSELPLICTKESCHLCYINVSMVRVNHPEKNVFISKDILNDY
jgi:hypothetical protein